MSRVRAVTFDLWDTLVADGSDEPKRAAMGLPPKKVEREARFVEWVVGNSGVSHDAARAAYAACSAQFHRVWTEEHRTPPVAERLEWALGEIGLSVEDGFDQVVAAIERMEADVPPDPAPGVRECLEQLRGRYQLGIVSDAIVTPGRELRRMIEGHGLLPYFDALVFSDEAGASKPSPRVFERAAHDLGVPVSAIAHVGDREAQDVAGAIGAGARAVLYTGCVDRGSSATAAHAICRDLRELPAAIERLGGEE